MTLEIQTINVDDYPPLTFGQATKLTNAIRLNVADLELRIVEAYYGRAWEALGYASWDDYVAGEFKQAPLAMPREDRRVQVASLRSQGLSQRAIGAVVGVDQSTVQRDLGGDANASPDSIVGIDGKEYQAQRNTRKQEIKEMAPEEREVCLYCGQVLPDHLQIPPNRRREKARSETNDDPGYEIVRPPLSATFALPTADDLLALRPGDHVKIAFHVDEELGERMWVKLTDTDSPTLWAGNLESHPVSIPLEFGDPVAFHPFDVISIALTAPDDILISKSSELETPVDGEDDQTTGESDTRSLRT